MARRSSKRRKGRGKHRIQRDQLSRLLPNALTMLGLCAGLTAIRFALEGQWNTAILLIAGAALLDTLDGRMARMMGGTSEFGGQLDSLVDAIAFGVAPVMMVYVWSLQTAGGIGWTIGLLFPVCCVLRLARFNVTSAEENRPDWAAGFFSGIPAPAGAGMVLLPLILFAETGWDWLGSPWLTGPWTLLVALMMISSMPVYSFKKLRLPSNGMVVALVVIAFMAAAMITEPRLTLSAIIIANTISIPFAIRAYRRLEAEEAAKKNLADETRGPDTGDGEAAPDPDVS